MSTQRQSAAYVSVVARLHDDAAIVEDFVTEVTGVLECHYENYELILVDDGSTDETVLRLRQLLERIPAVRVLRLSRRFGVEIAQTAGLESAIGDYVVILTPGSDPPSLIPAMVGIAESQNVLVYGVNKAWRSQPFLRRTAERFFYWSCRRIFHVDIAPHSTHFRVLNRPAVNAIVRIRDRYRHLRALTPFIGYRSLAFFYEPVYRPTYPRRDDLREAIDTGISIIVSNSSSPLRIVSWLGVIASFLNLAYIGYIAAVNLIKDRVAEGWTTLSLQQAVMFFVMFVILTVITEYVGRILNETQDRPLYYVYEELNSSVCDANAERRNLVAESS